MKITKKYVEPKIRFHKLKGERLLQSGSVKGAGTENYGIKTQSLTDDDWENEK